MLTFVNIFIRSLILAFLILSLQFLALTQESATTSVTYNVEHDHGVGMGKGELKITPETIEYFGISKNEGLHSRAWKDSDIKRIEIKKKELRLVIYEESRLPIIPRKAPFTDGKSVKVDTEHDYLFRLQDGEITEEIATALLERFKRPIASSIIPEKARQTAEPVFEIPVFHRHLRGGVSGILRIYRDFVIFDTEVEDQSRYWRYSDIRDIARIGKHKFELATYEGQLATDGKSYIFDLKRPMTDKEYDNLWNKIYNPF